MTASAVRTAAISAVVLALALANLATWPSLQSLWVFWRTIHDYEHGPLIALVAVAWMARIAWHGGLAGARPSMAGTALLGVLLLAWLITWRANINIAHQLLWPLVIGASLLAMLGGVVTRRFALALAFLYFGVPVWDYALPVLQRCSIFFSEKMLAVLGVKAAVSEYLVTIPEGTFAIIEGCSGKHYLVVTLAIAWLAAALNGIAGRRLALFMVISGVLSMITNWVRIVIIIYAGHVTNMQHYLVANEHVTLGNLLFVPLLAIVILLAGRLAPRQPVTPVAAPSTSAANAGAPGSLATKLLPVGLLLAVFGFVLWGRSAGGPPLVLGGLPLAVGRWQGPLPARSNWKPLYTAVDAEARAGYAKPTGESLELYANVYSWQENGRELIQYGNDLVSPVGWSRSWSATDGSLVTATETLASTQVSDPSGQRWLIAHIYRVGSDSYRTDFFAKLAYGWRSLAGQTPVGVIALAARCEPGNCDKASELVADFWENMRPDLLALVPAGVNVKP